MGLLGWIQTKYYHYNLWTGLYMLEPWEKALFSKSVAIASKGIACASRHSRGPCQAASWRLRPL